MFNRKKKSEQQILDDARKKTDALLDALMQNKDALTPQQQDELKAMIAAAGIAGSTMKAAQAIRKADDFGDKMHQQTMDMIEQAHQHTLKNPRPPAPTIDPKKLMDAAEVNVRTGKSIKVMQPIKLGQKKQGWKWLR